MRLDTQLITYISEQLTDYRDDLDAFWDTLDGETDVMDAVGQIIQDMIEADAALTGVQEIMDRYAQRQSAIRSRKEALQRTLKSICLMTGQTKIPHPLGTVSLREGSKSVHITDLDAIPSQLCKITKTPDKTAIKKQIEAGETIDGAEIVIGPQTISVRIK